MTLQELREIVEEADARPLTDIEAIAYANANLWLNENKKRLGALVVELGEALAHVEAQTVCTAQSVSSKHEAFCPRHTARAALAKFSELEAK
jgi:cell division ATPase FtsA